MATSNSEKHPPLEPEDVRNYYNAGIEQHSNEFRTLGDRANTFLLTQSILLTAFILILINRTIFPILFDIIRIGIILLGIFFCWLYIRAGRSGAYSAYAWRKYLLHLENKHPDAPWNWFKKYFESKTEKAIKEAKCCVTKFLMERHPWVIDEGALAKKLPLPSSWIFSTSAFLVVWVCASFYVLRDYGMVYCHQTSPWLFIPIIALSSIVLLFIMIFSVYLLRQACKEWNHPYSN